MTQPTQAQIEAAALLDDLLQASIDYAEAGPNGLRDARSEFHTKKAKVLAALTAAAQVGGTSVTQAQIEAAAGAMSYIDSEKYPENWYLTLAEAALTAAAAI